MLKKPSRFSPSRRTGIILLGLWGVALLLIAGYTIKLLRDENQLNLETRRFTRAHALALLAERVDLALTVALRRPVRVLKNLSSEQMGAERMDVLWSTFPFLRRVMLLNHQLNVVRAFPTLECSELDHLLIERVRLERMTARLEAFGIYMFVMEIPNERWLFMLEPINDTNVPSGWLLLGFDLSDLLAQQLQPMLEEFGRQEGGQVTLREPTDKWDDASIQIPLNHVLPGHFLAFRPDPALEIGSSTLHWSLPLTLSLAILVAMGLASWSVFVEISRGYDVAELRQRFVANISHELKTPLALIRMYAETLHLERIVDPKQVRQYHQIILREAERLSEMIQNVLTFARLDQREVVFHLRSDDLARTVIEILEEIRPNLEGRGLILRSELETDLPPLSHEREGVTRILWNLLDNAVKYAGNSEVEVCLYRLGDQVRLEVVDKGPGIPAADRARLLRPFERGWETGTVSGSGLGLALVTQVAEIHGAIFSLEKGFDGGLCARVAFPVREAT
ncbi:Histidine kinase domain-containing protein [Gammaproteobacteria bacterium]